MYSVPADQQEALCGSLLSNLSQYCTPYQGYRGKQTHRHLLSVWCCVSCLFFPVHSNTLILYVNLSLPLSQDRGRQLGLSQSDCHVSQQDPDGAIQTALWPTARASLLTCCRTGRICRCWSFQRCVCLCVCLLLWGLLVCLRVYLLSYHCSHLHSVCLSVCLSVATEQDRV